MPAERQDGYAEVVVESPSSFRPARVDQGKPSRIVTALRRQ